MSRLYFNGDAPKLAGEDFRYVERVFPPEVANVLSSLSRFPNLQTLILDFNFQWAAEDHGESKEVTEKAEASERRASFGDENASKILNPNVKWLHRDGGQTLGIRRVFCL